MSVRDLLANPLLGLRRADTLGPRHNAMPLDQIPGLKAGGVHEWFLEGTRPDAALPGDWRDARATWTFPPLTILGALAVRNTTQGTTYGTIAWIGRSCWPTLKLLHDLHGETAFVPALERSLFIDPADKQRFWVLEEVLRCPGIQAVVADGAGITPTVSRRLQLAAEAGGAIALLARPPSEATQPSWATTRWRVRTVASEIMCPRWEIAADRGAPEARWIVEYEVRNGQGALHLPADMGSRSLASPRRHSSA